MQVVEKEMYHFHKKNKFDKIWKPKNEIIIDNSFNGDFLENIKKYTTAVMLDNNEKETFSYTIDRYLKANHDIEIYKEMLVNASNIIKQLNILKRELILEQIRQQYYPELPSRKHSIWLCDGKQVDYWNEILSEDNNIMLFKVLITGNLFKSSEAFMPQDISTYGENIREAEQYWNPKFETEDQENRAEYLFQGKLKILKKVIVL